VLGVIVALSVVRTTIPLAALGYPEGIPLTGGAITFRLPAQPGLQRIEVRFPIDASGALAHAQLRLYVDGRQVAARSGAQLRNATLQADVPVRKGERSVSITLLSRLIQCGDHAATYRAFVKNTGNVTVTQDASAAQAARASYAGAYTVLEPAHPDASWEARALAAAYALHVVEGWRRVTVALGATPAPGTLGVSDLGAISLPAREPPNGERAFADLGLSPLEQSGEDVNFVLPFTLGQLRGVPNLLVAMVHVRANAPGRVEAVLNGREINAFSVTAGAQILRVPIAVSGLRGTNALRIEMRFSHPQTFCESNAPNVSIEGSELQWSGHGDLPMTLERGVSELSGRVTVESDPAIFAQAFAVMNALGLVNRSIDAIDARAVERGATQPGEIEIAAAPGPDIEAAQPASYGEVRVERNGAIVVSYIGDPAVLQRLPQFSGVLAGSDATRIEFGTTGAILTRSDPFLTRAQERQRMRWIIWAAFILVLVVATFLIARRARRFS
jgi:hypothetical protein